MIFRMVYKSGQIFLPFCHNSRVWQTDGQIDRRTDRILIARPRLHSMQRGKNWTSQSMFKILPLARTQVCKRVGHWSTASSTRKRGIAAWRPPDGVRRCIWFVFSAYTHTANCELPIKILTSSLDSVTQISKKNGAVIWQSDDLFTLWPRSLTPWPRPVVVDLVSRGHTLY